MSLTLTFAGEALGVALGLNVARTGQAPDVIETWRVELEVEAVTPAALEPIVSTLRDAQGSSGELKLQADGADVRVLEATDCRHGPTLQAVTELDRAPGEAHNRRRITLEFRATLQEAASAVQTHHYTARAISKPGQPDRLVTSGSATLRAGEQPSDSEALVLPLLASGFRRVREVVTRDTQAPSLAYEVEDEQVFSALPGGVDDGHFIVSDFIDTDGRTRRAISGFFSGASARSRALEQRPGNALVSSRVSENPFTRRVDFEFVELVEASGTLALTESLTFTTSRRVVDHPLLDASLPSYRQQIGAPQTEVVQEGRAVGDGRHVSPPAPRYAADLLERQVHYSLPHAGLPADRRWVTTWRYVSRGRAGIFAGAPNA